MLTDTQDTTYATVNAANLAVTQRWQDPYGVPRGPAPTGWPTATATSGDIRTAQAWIAASPVRRSTRSPIGPASRSPLRSRPPTPTHDSAALKPLVNAIPAIRSRRGPRRHKPAKLHADKAYDIPAQRTWLRQRGTIPRIARKGIESSTKLGKHRWVIERSIAWLMGYRRLTIRYDRKPTHFLAFLTLGAAITCYKKLAK
jgi:transposase